MGTAEANSVTFLSSLIINCGAAAEPVNGFYIALAALYFIGSFLSQTGCLNAPQQ